MKKYYLSFHLFRGISVGVGLIAGLLLGHEASAAKGAGGVSKRPPALSAQWSLARQDVAENVGSVSLTVQLSAPAPQNLVFPYTVQGTSSFQDHSAPPSGTITVNSGATEATVSFDVKDDAIFESAETIVFTLGKPSIRGLKLSIGTNSVQTISIADNDPPPVLLFAAAAQSASEDAGTLNVNVQLDGPSSKDVKATIQLSGTATSGTDFSLESTALLIPAGATMASVKVNLLNDDLYEGAETIVLSLTNPLDATLGTVSTHTLTLTDDDTPPILAWTTASQSLAESAGQATVAASLSRASSTEISAPFVVTGIATAPGDHDLISGKIVFAPGQTQSAVTFKVSDDSMTELEETVILTLGTPSQGSLGATSVHTLAIQDNDLAAPPVASWSMAFQTVSESAGPVMITAQLDKESLAPITIPYVVSGTAQRPSDHDLANGTITIPAGSLSASILFNVIDDASYEDAETLSVAMGAPSGAALGSPAVHLVTITDNDGAPTIQFATAEQALVESAGMASVSVTLSQASGKDTTVGYSVAGSAVSPSDHNLSQGSVTIPAGQTSRNISFSIVDDALYEGDETVAIALNSPVNASLGTPATHQLTVTDNDLAPTVAFATASQTVEEAAGTATIAIRLSGISTSPTTVAYTVAGTALNPGDHNLAAGSLTIAAGQNSGNLTFAIVKDGVTEADETVIVTLASAAGATLAASTTHTVTITDAIATPTMQWTLLTQAVAESAGTFQAAVSLNAPSSANIVANYTIGGTAGVPGDYAALSGTLTIPAGSVTASIPIVLADDQIDENDETIVLTLVSATGAVLGANKIHTATIQDNDLPPNVVFAAAAQSAQENAGTVNVAVNLSVMSGKDISVPYSVAGTASSLDHNLTAGTILFPAGTTARQLSFNLVNDSTVEMDELVQISLDAPTGATLGAQTSHTVTIKDDDTLSIVQWSLASSTVAENAGTVKITASLNALHAFPVIVPFTVTGTATNPADHGLASGTLTIPAGVLSADANLVIANDTLYEGPETVILTLGNPNPSTVSLGSRIVHTATITDDDATPTVRFNLASQLVQENAGTVTVAVVLDKASYDSVSVPYTVTGTASNPADHNLAAGNLSFPAGSTSQNLTFSVVSDTFYEPDETVIITLGVPTGATLGAIKAYTATIVNDDPLPTLEWTIATQTGTEGFTATVNAKLSAASPVAITAPITVTGTAASADFNLGVASLSIPAGSTMASVSVILTDDALNEDAETVILTLGTPSGAALGAVSTHTISILDNDAPPTLKWTVAQQNADENAGSATAIATLSAPSGKVITAPFTVAGNANNVNLGRVKHTLVPGTLTFPAGSTSQNLNVPLVNDNVAGPSDFVILLMLGNPTGAGLGTPMNQTLTIIDNDTAPAQGMEGFRKSVWILTRERCIGCHNGSAFLPNHASDDLPVAYNAALPRVSFLDIPSSRLVFKTTDNHCGNPAICDDLEGTPTETKPLMIAAIQQWAMYENGSIPVPSPSPSTGPSPSPTSNPLTGGSVGIKDGTQYIEFLADSTGLASGTYRTANLYNGDLKYRMSADGDPLGVSPPVLLAYLNMASRVCLDFVNKEKGFAINNASRIAYGPIDFVTGANIATNVLSTANMATVTTNLTRLFLRRDPTAEEIAAQLTMVMSAISGRTLTATDTLQLMVMTCTTVATSLDAIQY